MWVWIARRFGDRVRVENSALWPAVGSLIVVIMSFSGPIVCSICDKPETQCLCVRYCCICTGLEGVRLCADGLYYCPACREACEVKLADHHA